MKKKLLVATLGLVMVILATSVAFGQLAENEVYRGDAFQVEATHNGVDTDSYQLLRDGEVVTTRPVSALQSGTITFDHPAIADAGTYELRVVAVGPGGSTSSAPLTLVVKVRPPSAPSVPRIIRIP